MSLQPCLPWNTIRRCLDAALPEDLQQPVQDHVDACPACMEAYRTLAEPAGRRPVVPGFVVLRRLGRGGQGIAWLARDRMTRRYVVLKDLQGDGAAGRGPRARIAGRLTHQNIIPIYRVGRDVHGRAFTVMPLIWRGGKPRDLGHEIRRFHADRGAGHRMAARDIRFRRLIGHFLDVCHAARYAHRQRVLHLDIKPKNVVIGPDGQTFLIDWDTAVELDRSMQAATHRLGSPGYESPEQARPGALVGPASDVYGLGATLLHLANGEPPPVGGKAARPGPSVPPELGSIIRKAMNPDPRGRYPSPIELAEDLYRWLADEEVLAHFYPWPQRLARRVRSDQLVQVVVLAFTLCIGAGIVGTLSALYYTTTVARDAALRDASFARDRALGEVESQKAALQAVKDQLDQARREYDRAVGKRVIDDAVKLGDDPGLSARLKAARQLSIERSLDALKDNSRRPGNPAGDAGRSAPPPAAVPPLEPNLMADDVIQTAARSSRPGVEPAERRRLVDEALVKLAEAVRAGWDDRERLENDRELEPLRNRPEFRAIRIELILRHPFAPEE